MDLAPFLLFACHGTFMGLCVCLTLPDSTVASSAVGPPLRTSFIMHLIVRHVF